MQCPNCGSDLKPGTSFCLNCGYYVEENGNKDAENLVDFTSEEDFNNDDTDNRTKKKFNWKDNIVYIVLGTILFFSVILLIYGIVTKNKASEVTTTPTPTVQKTAKTVSVSDYKLTVPAGLDYQIEDESIFISDEEVYNFSFRIKVGDYTRYSDNIELLSDQLVESGYDIKDSEKKTINDTEMIIYTISLDSDTKYLYITEFDSERVAMGVISIHNSKSIDSICEVVLDVLETVEYDEDSSTGVTDATTSIVEGLNSLLN